MHMALSCGCGTSVGSSAEQ